MRKSLSGLSRANLIQHQQSSSSTAGESCEGHHYSSSNKVWRNVDDFLLEHIGEVLRKFDTNSSKLDDEIWGKIVLMEGGSRLAKAYLRNHVVVVDGSEHEFDGLRIGFNRFRNVLDSRDDFCKKIGDGVAIKMDADGNIKAMARGTVPIYVQGWKERKTKNCISKKLWLNQGRLTPRSANVSDNDRIFKVFDMAQFKCSLAEINSSSDIRSLLFKTCIRMAMVKDGGEDNLSKSPCWFLVVNMIAIDMVRRKLSLSSSKIGYYICDKPDIKKVSDENLKTILEPTTSDSPVNATKDPLMSLLTAAIQKVQNGCVEVELETDSIGEDVMQKLATKLAMSIIAKQGKESGLNSAEKSSPTSASILRLSSSNQGAISSTSSMANDRSGVDERNLFGRKSSLQQYNGIIPSIMSSSTLSSSSNSLILTEEPVRIPDQERQPSHVKQQRCETSNSSIPTNYQIRRAHLSKSLIHSNESRTAYSKSASLTNKHGEWNTNTSDYESHTNGNGMHDAASSLSYNSSPESDTDSNNSQKKCDYLDIRRAGLYRTQIGFETDSVPHYYSQPEEYSSPMFHQKLHKHIKFSTFETETATVSAKKVSKNDVLNLIYSKEYIPKRKAEQRFFLFPSKTIQASDSAAKPTNNFYQKYFYSLQPKLMSTFTSKKCSGRHIIQQSQSYNTLAYPIRRSKRSASPRNLCSKRIKADWFRCRDQSQSNLNQVDVCVVKEDRLQESPASPRNYSKGGKACRMFQKSQRTGVANRTGRNLTLKPGKTTNPPLFSHRITDMVTQL